MSMLETLGGMIQMYHQIHVTAYTLAFYEDQNRNHSTHWHGLIAN